ncbi:hypothetical protein [Streptomyces boluensis]|uniref:Uncharacterized protein n=1 Tax=Streptomyces boluensis TaxID=1775135 RepID=A0A964XLC9_9ACTN|nr:hypothetical protein [Streptomyces boluensis]NBE51981.1 hypothetical protein [Streptomyces boluensis]
MSSAPTADLAHVRTLIDITRKTGLDGHLPGRDVVRGQIRELSGYLNALRGTIATRGRDPGDRQLRRDAMLVLTQVPEPDESTMRQAERLRQLALVTGQFLDLAETRSEASG